MNNLIGHRRIGIVLVCSILFQFLSIDFYFKIKAFMLVVPVIWVINRCRFFLPPSTAVKFWFLVLFIFNLTGFYAYSPELALRFNLGFLLFSLIFVMAYSFLRNRTFDEVIDVFILSGIIFNLLSFVLYLYGLSIINGNFLQFNGSGSFGVFVDRGIPRLNGLVDDPNFFAVFNFVFVFIALSDLNSKLSKFLFILALMNILLTFSRGGIIALIIGFFIYFLSQKGSKKITILFTFILVTFPLVLLITSNYLPYLTEFFIQRTSTSSSGSGRVEIWSNAISIFQENPIFGIGVFSFKEYNFDKFNDYHFMHNTFLEILIEGGIIIFSLYMLSCFLFFIEIYKYGSKKHIPWLTASWATTYVSLVFLSGIISEPILILLTLHSCYIYCTKTGRLNYGEK